MWQYLGSRVEFEMGSGVSQISLQIKKIPKGDGVIQGAAVKFLAGVGLEPTTFRL